MRCFHCENTAKKFQKNALVKNGGVGHFFWAGVLSTADFPVSQTPTPHRYPIHEHRVPSHLACNLSAPLSTTKTSLSVSNSEKTEVSIKKGLLMPDYKHAVGPAIDKELTKMFVTYQALVLINKQDIPPGCSFFRFFLFLKPKFLPIFIIITILIMITILIIIVWNQEDVSY